MKLLFIVPNISSSGGVEKVVAMLTSYLIDTYQHQVTILNAESFSGNSFYELHRQIDVDSLNLSAYPLAAFAKIKWYGHLKKAMGLYLNKHDFDLVLAQGAYVSACLNFVKADVIKVGCAHTSYSAVHFLPRLLSRILYGKLDAFVVLTEHDKKWYAKKITNVFTIPNFIGRLPDELSDLQDMVVVAAGRLVAQKGFDLLITAFNEVHKQFPHWKLEIYGEGKERPSLERQIANLGLQDMVSLPGETAALHAKLRNAAIFVLSSRFEGFPLILLEAMSFGLCCISFDIMGANAVLRNNNNGLLVPPFQIGRLADTICRAIADIELRKQLAAGGRKTAQRYQVTEVGNQWQHLIEQLSKMK